MKETTDQASIDIELRPALLEHAHVLANLLEFYSHDFSEFLPLEIGEDGRFGYTPLPLYWTDPDRHPFLLRVKGNLAGLALVKRGSERSANLDTWDLTEFFVLRRYRRQGIGTRAAHQLWQRFPGLWEVRVLQSNVSACHFWHRALSTFTGRQVPPMAFEQSRQLWYLFSFHSQQPASEHPAFLSGSEHGPT